MKQFLTIYFSTKSSLIANKNFKKAKEKGEIFLKDFLLAINDLSGSKQIMNLVDSAFAIGDSKQENGLHYIKQVKSRNARYQFDKDNVLVCRIVKEDNFLKFVIRGTALELDHLESAEPMNREKLYDLIKREYPKGKSARSIADQAGYSHTTINKIVAELIRNGQLKERGNGNLTEMP